MSALFAGLSIAIFAIMITVQVTFSRILKSSSQRAFFATEVPKSDRLFIEILNFFLPTIFIGGKLQPNQEVIDFSYSIQNLKLYSPMKEGILQSLRIFSRSEHTQNILRRHLPLILITVFTTLH